jgi:hypothetical protein
MTAAPGSAGDVTATHSFSGTVNRASGAGFVVGNAVVSSTATMALTSTVATGSGAGAAAIESDLDITSVAATGSGTGSSAPGDPPEFISLETAGATDSFFATVPSGTRLMVATIYSTDSHGARTCTYDSESLDVANNANGFVQQFYMFDPPVGGATFAVTGTFVSSMVVAYYG